MALNTYALRLVAARKHWVDFQGASLRKSSLRGLDKFTWEAWIKVGAGSTSPDQRAYVESQTDSASKIRFACTPTRENNRSILRFEFQRKDGGTPSAYTYVLPQAWDDRWHHVAFSADIGNRQYALFYDGVQVQKGTLIGGGTYRDKDDPDTEKPYLVGGEIKNEQDDDGEEIVNENKYIPKKISIGAYHGSNGRTYWDGKIDNVRIWKNFKNGGTFGNEMFDHIDDYATNSNLVEEWRFNEGPNYTAADPGGGDNTTDPTGDDDDGSMFEGDGDVNPLGAVYAASVFSSTEENVNLAGIGRGDETPISVMATGGEFNPGDDPGNTGVGDENWSNLAEETGGSEEEYTNVPEPVGPTASGNVTRGTRYVRNTAVLMKGNDTKGGAELWIGVDTWGDYGTLAHDFDRPFIGDGLFDTTPPTRPAGLQELIAARSENSISVKWNRSEDDVYVQRYELDVAVDAGFQNTITGFNARNMGRATQATITGLQPGSKYFWRVRAVDSSNNVSPWASNTALRQYKAGGTVRINYSRNPSLESGTDYWAPVTVSGPYPDLTRVLYVEGVGSGQYEDYPLKNPTTFGDHYLRITNLQSQSGADSGVAHSIPWKTQQIMTGSFYVRGTGTFKVVVIPKKYHVPLYDNDADTEPLVLTFAGSSANIKRCTASPTEWKRVSFTVKPRRSGMTGVEIRILSVGGDYSFDIDGMMVEKGRVASPYFDGDTNNDTYWVLPWNHTSTGSVGWVTEPANEQSFGYTHLTPSATNITVSPINFGITTPSLIDRREPGVPKTEDVVLTADEVTYRSFLARWKAPDTNFEDIVGYELQVATTQNMSSTVAVFVPGYELLRVGNVQFRQILGLKPKKKYYYRVRAYDELSNVSPWSSVVAVTTEAEPDLEPPKDVTLLDPFIHDTDSFEARWLPTYDNVGVAGYLLNVALNSPGNFIMQDVPVLATETSKVIRGLAPAQTYYYSVRAFDAAGNISRGLIIDPATNKPVPGTYMEARTASAVEDSGDRDATVPVETAAIDPLTPNTPSGTTDSAFVLTPGGRKMLVQMNLQGLAGELLAANLLLSRKAHLGSASPSLAASLFGLTHVEAQLRAPTDRRMPVLDWNKEVILPSVRLKITALELPVEYTKRYDDLFVAGDVTWSSQPPVQARAITYDWDRETASIDLTDLISGGMRMYGFLIEADAEVLIYTARAEASLRPTLTVQYDDQQAFALIDTEVSTSMVVSRNVFTNTTFDVVASRMPLDNPTFQAADTRGWTPDLITANTTATLARANNGADEYGGSGVLTISAMTLPATTPLGTWDASLNWPVLSDLTGTEGAVYEVSHSGVQKLGSRYEQYLKGEYVSYENGTWLRQGHDRKRAVRVANKRRFPVTFGYEYTVTARVRTDNTSLTPRLGILWYMEETDSTPLTAIYDVPWTPRRANEWETRSVTATPPALARINNSDKVAVRNAQGQWVVAPGQPGEGAVVARDDLNEIGPTYAEVEIYPWVNTGTSPQTGSIFFDDVQVHVDSGKQPIGVAPVGETDLSRQTSGVAPFTKKADDYETDVVLKFSTTRIDDGVRLFAPLNDEQYWLNAEAANATVNLIENPSFESPFGVGASDKYIAMGNAEISRDTSRSKFGGYALKMQRYSSGNVSDGVRLHTARINDKRKGALRGSYHASGNGSYQCRLLLKYADSASVVAGPWSYNNDVGGDSTKYDWGFYSCVVALDETRVLEYAALEVVGATKADVTTYIDAVQVEQVDEIDVGPSAYCDGNQYESKCFWTGAPDQSVSFRSAFVGHVRVKSSDFDPALTARLRLRYANGETYTSIPATMPVLAMWDNNYAESAESNEQPNSNFEADALNAPPKSWRVVSYPSTVTFWKVTNAKASNRFGPASGRSVQALINRVETGQNTAAHLQSVSKSFTVVPGQTVTGLAYALTEDTNLTPYLQLFFYNALNELVGSSVPSLRNFAADEWTTLRVQAVAPPNAQYCQLGLKVHASAVTYLKSAYFDSIWLGLDNQAVENAWVPLVTLPVAPNPQNILDKIDLVSVEMDILSSRAQTIEGYLDGGTIQFNAESPTTFNGATLDADWVGEPFNSPSELYAVRLVNSTSYRGDANSTATIATFVKPVTWPVDDRTDEGSTLYVRRRRRAHTVLPTIIRWNELSNPSFEVSATTAEGWESSSASVLRTKTVSTAAAGSAVAEWTIGATDNAIRLTPTDLVPAAEGQVWTTSIKAKATNSNRLTPIGGVLTLTFYNARGERLRNVLSTAEEPFDLVVGADWETVSATAIAPAGTALVSMEIVPLRERGVLGMQGGDVFQFDAAMLYNGYRGRPYYDGSTGLYWEGVSHGSPTIFVMRAGERYRVRTVPYDEDGVAGESIQEAMREVQTPAKPSFYTEFKFDEAVIDAFSTYCDIFVPYAGAKDQNVIALADIRRADTYDWEDVPVEIDEINRQIIIRKGGLSPNVSYVVRVTVDAENGTLRGRNRFLFTITTPVSDANDVKQADGTISFDDFVLNGPDALYYWVSAQNSFSLPPLRVQMEQLPRTDGAVELNAYWDRKSITLEGGVWGEDRVQLDANLKALRAVLSGRKKRLRIDTLTQSNTYYTATCSGFQVNEVAGENLTSLTWSATFECANPFLYNAEENVNEFKIKADGSVLTAEDILSSDQRLTVNNRGTVNALPKIVIDTKTSRGNYAVVLYNDTTGGRFFPKTTLSGGDVLEIDTERKLCRRKGGTAVDYLGSFLEVQPGSNQFRLSIRSLSAKRHNLLENPSADDDLNLGSASGPNIYPTFEFVNNAKSEITGTVLTQTRDQTYNGSPLSLFVECSGSKPGQGVIFRTPKGLSAAQSWDEKKRTFTATAAVRTDVTNRDWTLDKCFIRIWYADGTMQELVNADGTLVAPSTIAMKSAWQTLTFSAIESRKKAINFIELVISTPNAQNNAYLGKPVSFYVDDCKLAESAASSTDASLNFAVNINYYERFI